MIAARDRDATTYVKHYWWWFKKRFDKNYHLYMFKKIKSFKTLPKFFELPKNGVLGNKTEIGWVRNSVELGQLKTNNSPMDESDHKHFPELRGVKKEADTEAILK